MTEAVLQPSVRLATASDVDLLVALRLEFCERDEPLTAAHRAAIGADLRQELPARLANGQLVTALVHVADKPAATAWVDLGMRFIGSSVGPVGTLFNVWTRPEYRRRGLARVAVSICVDEARRLGADRVDLTATAEGMGLYEALGFTVNPYPAMRIMLRPSD